MSELMSNECLDLLERMYGLYGRAKRSVPSDLIEVGKFRVAPGAWEELQAGSGDYGGAFCFGIPVVRDFHLPPGAVHLTVDFVG